ncbi:protein AGE2, putative [Pediculus humanus corporis]|uniref:Protein AGE2, putative n=1 Tax=Pediculus humanus subsp. corporis TaxID=121224 RepID=E0VER7_PEDHC|nr:protein AGE2, putative [Pediculus humanus corporis]EEB11873.1 protein AGE2, putative [Pediculus humanus corporis]
MASSRKKQDEINLKILRKLVSLPGNKQCFDCNQRGPTYVNVTIGSFVCTTCSGLLRGLTPPHRLKSISMATFTSEEIESLKSKGNEYCKKVWLASYNSENIQNAKDEHLVRDFMVAKYEKKLYFMEPSSVVKNGDSSLVDSNIANSKSPRSNTKTSFVTSPKETKSIQVVNTGSVNSDLFKVGTNVTFSQKSNVQDKNLPYNREISFANFDNNPIFNACVVPAENSFLPPKSNSTTEDKYAALKDLDCLMKMQQGSPQYQGSPGNSWSPKSSDISVTSNPFQSALGNNNSVNPFRSGYGLNRGDNNTVIYNNGNNPWQSGYTWISNDLSASHKTLPTSSWNRKEDKLKPKMTFYCLLTTTVKSTTTTTVKSHPCVF